MVQVSDGWQLLLLCLWILKPGHGFQSSWSLHKWLYDHAPIWLLQLTVSWVADRMVNWPTLEHTLQIFHSILQVWHSSEFAIFQRSHDKRLLFQPRHIFNKRKFCNIKWNLTCLVLNRYCKMPRRSRTYELFRLVRSNSDWLMPTKSLYDL